MEAIGFLALATLVIKIVSVIKAIGKDTNLVVTQALVWGVGIAVLWLASVADLTEHLVPPGFSAPLGALDGASIVLGGLILGSTGAFGYDATIGRNRTEPALLPGVPPNH